MTEEEYESLYEALVAAHNILPEEEDREKIEADFRKKIRKLEKPSWRAKRRQRDAGQVKQPRNSGSPPHPMFPCEAGCLV